MVQGLDLYRIWEFHLYEVVAFALYQFPILMNLIIREHILNTMPHYIYYYLYPITMNLPLWFNVIKLVTEEVKQKAGCQQMNQTRQGTAIIKLTVQPHLLDKKQECYYFMFYWRVFLHFLKSKGFRNFFTVYSLAQRNAWLGQQITWFCIWKAFSSLSQLLNSSRLQLLGPISCSTLVKWRPDRSFPHTKLAYL